MKNSPSFTRKPLFCAISVAVLAFSGEVTSVQAGSISNSGSIYGTSSGIYLTSSSVNGSVSNSGSISGTYVPIYSSGSVGGDIVNSGTIDATPTGIYIYSSTVSGSVINSGTIDVSQYGIYINNSTVGGGVVNTGLIDPQYGMYIINSNIASDVSNGGIITASSTGIYIGSSNIGGDVVNTGTITADEVGIKIDTYSNVVGAISNSGIINADHQGIYVISADVNGSIINSGTINSGEGISVVVSTINENIFNSGSISATDGMVAYQSSVGGSISNSGTISAVTGISALSSTVVGSIINSGTINTSGTSSYGGLGILSISSSISGDVINSGNIFAVTNGIYINASNVDGNIANDNTIYGRNSIYVGDSSISGSIINNDTLVAFNKGINVFQSSIAGNVNNNSIITGASSAAAIGILVRSSSISGGINNNGTINAYEAIEIDNSTISGNIFNDGLINTSAYPIDNYNEGIKLNSTHIYGSVINDGAINANSQGIDISSSTVEGGITNNGTIYGGVIGIDISNSILGGDIVNSGVISGEDYSIYVNSNSTLNAIDVVGTNSHLMGDVYASNTDINIESGAEFASQGNYTIDQFNIASSARFTLSNGDDITSSGGVNNSGTFAIGDNTAQSITGNYTQNAGGVFEVGAKNTNSYGKLTVGGNADLTSSGNFNLDLSDGYSFANGDVLNNVISAGSLATGAMTVADNSYLLDFSVINDGNNGIDILTMINPSAGANSGCEKTVCQGAANAIIRAMSNGNSDFNPYGTLPDAHSFKIAASEASPELVGENTHVISEMIDSVLDVVKDKTGAGGASSGDAMLSDPGKAWLRVYGAKINQDQRDGVDGYDSRAHGVVAGNDTALSDSVMAGMAIAVGNNNLDGDGAISGQSVDSDIYQGIVYANKNLANNVYVAGQGVLGVSKNDSKRHITLFGDTAKASYDSWFSNIRGEVGREYQINDRFGLTPSLSASYVYISEESYTEHGSTMDLHVNSNDQDALVFGADAGAVYKLPSLIEKQMIALTAHVGVAYNVLDSQSSVKSNFVSGGPEFTTDGVDYDDVVLRGGAGVEVNSSGPLSGSINYDVQSGNDANSDILSASIKYKF